MTTESKEVATKGSTELATFESGAWGAGQEVVQEDLVVGKILIMQPQSRTVIKGLAKHGELRNSLDDSVVGPDGNIDVVIFSQDKVWVIYEVTTEKGKEVTQWKETFAWTPENAKLEWNEQVGNVKINRQKAFNFYCIVKNDEYKTNLPLIIRMKSTSYNTGRRLSTLFAQMRAAGHPSAAKVLTMSVRQEENDRGIYYVWDFAEKEDTTKDEQMVAYKWYMGLKDSQFRVDESEEVGEVVGTGAAPKDDVDFI